MSKIIVLHKQQTTTVKFIYEYVACHQIDSFIENKRYNFFRIKNILLDFLFFFAVIRRLNIFFSILSLFML